MIERPKGWSAPALAAPRALFLVCVLVATAGCASLGDLSAKAARSEAPAVAYAMEAESPRAAPAAASGRAAPAAPSVSRSASTAPAQAPASVASKPAQPAQPAEPAERLRVYSGYLELVVGEPERVLERVIDVVGQMGGYVESTTAEYVVLRVPAAKFDAAMDGLAALGELRSRSVESTDVTESYADLGRRIDVAKRTRARLYALLEKTTDVDERVKILREIRRLTEDIEQMSSALDTLERQISLSRITVKLVSRLDESGGATARIPFPWIAGLSPLRTSAGAAAGPVELGIAAEYAVFESGRRVRIEASDGTRMTVGAVPNEPRGDTAFWRQALLFHLAGLYRSAEPVSAGAFEGAVLASKDVQPFSYLVVAAVRGEEILVAEAFFPNVQAREKRLAGVLAMLEGVKP
jgi:hypothetical protein